MREINVFLIVPDGMMVFVNGALLQGGLVGEAHALVRREVQETVDLFKLNDGLTFKSRLVGRGSDIALEIAACAPEPAAPAGAGGFAN